MAFDEVGNRFLEDGESADQNAGQSQQIQIVEGRY
jgi:hypothetical protein